jgi:hypothetical protein
MPNTDRTEERKELAAFFADHLPGATSFEHRLLADAILAAGYRKTVTSPAVPRFSCDYTAGRYCLVHATYGKEGWPCDKARSLAREGFSDR